MSSPIDGYISQIRNAVYGKDVRSAIADGISTCYTDVAAGVTRADAAANMLTGGWTVSATSVVGDPTASITVDQEGISLSLGIPKGDKGDTGAAGADGTDGVTPAITAGDVTTLAAGSSATVTITGTTAAPVLNFGIPQGAKGSTGSKGSKGDKGDKGDTGITPAITVSEPVTLPAGSAATVSITGTAEAPVLNFGIPQGAPGTIQNANGESIPISASSQTMIKEYVDSINTTLSGNVSTLTTNLSNEVTARTNADNGFNTRITSIETYLQDLVDNTIIDGLYPVGSIYISINSTLPSILTASNREWQHIDGGYMLRTIASNDNSGGGTVAATATGPHTLTYNEIPPHTHPITGVMSWPTNEADTQHAASDWGTYLAPKTTVVQSTGNNTTTGSGHTHPGSVPAHVKVHMWKRIA